MMSPLRTNSPYRPQDLLILYLTSWIEVMVNVDRPWLSIKISVSESGNRLITRGRLF